MLCLRRVALRAPLQQAGRGGVLRRHYPEWFACCMALRPLYAAVTSLLAWRLPGACWFSCFQALPRRAALCCRQRTARVLTPGIACVVHSVRLQALNNSQRSFTVCIIMSYQAPFEPASKGGIRTVHTLGGMLCETAGKGRHLAQPEHLQHSRCKTPATAPTRQWSATRKSVLCPSIHHPA